MTEVNALKEAISKLESQLYRSPGFHGGGGLIACAILSSKIVDLELALVRAQEIEGGVME